MNHDQVVLAVLPGTLVIPLNKCSFLKNKLLPSVRESISLQIPRYWFFTGSIRRMLNYRVIHHVWDICIFFHAKWGLFPVITYTRARI